MTKISQTRPFHADSASIFASISLRLSLPHNLAASVAGQSGHPTTLLAVAGRRARYALGVVDSTADAPECMLAESDAD